MPIYYISKTKVKSETAFLFYSNHLTRDTESKLVFSIILIICCCCCFPGVNSILLKTSNKWFVLKTTSRKLAVDWLKCLKTAEESKKLFGSRRESLVEHL